MWHEPSQQAIELARKVTREALGRVYVDGLPVLSEEERKEREKQQRRERIARQLANLTSEASLEKRRARPSVFGWEKIEPGKAKFYPLPPDKHPTKWAKLLSQQAKRWGDVRGFTLVSRRQDDGVWVERIK